MTLRAQRLSPQLRQEIAAKGAKARKESLRLTRMIENNFEYVAAIYQLHSVKAVIREDTSDKKLPGFYA